MSLTNDFKTRLLKRLDERLLRHGLVRAKRREQSFERASELGKEALHVAFIDHDGDFDVTADVAIRLDSLEDLMNEERTWLSNREKEDMFSIGCELGNLRDGKQKRWTVRCEEDVDTVVDSIVAMFEEIGLPYFGRFSTMEAVFVVMADDTPAAWQHMPLHDDRAKAAVALAHLLDRHEELGDLVERKAKFLSDQDEAVEEFREFAAAIVADVEGEKKPHPG